MTIPEFKKIAGLLKKVYVELEQEAIQAGIDLLSPQYDELVAKARETVLANAGFTLEEYREVKQQVSGVSKAGVLDFIQKTRDEVSQLDKRHIPTHEEIAAIARDVAAEFIKPPQVIHQIVKEITKEKPQIIKETVREKVVELDTTALEGVRKEVESFRNNFNDLNDRFSKLPPTPDVNKLREEIQNDFAKHFKHNIDMFGMPDFRKLAMGLQQQIDDLSSQSSTGTGGGHVIEDEGTPVTQRTKLNFVGSSVAVTDDSGNDATVVTISGGGFTELTATGSVNSSNTTFTFTQVPTYIVADGIMMKKLDDNGNTQWSNVGTTITMVNPPSFAIFGIA